MTSKNWGDYQMPKHIPQGIPVLHYFSMTVFLWPHFSVNQLVWRLFLHQSLCFCLTLWPDFFTVWTTAASKAQLKFAIWLNNVIYVKKKHILSHSPFLKCACYYHIYHVYCLPCVSKADSIYVNRHIEDWICIQCIEGVFPFNHYQEEYEFFMACRNSGIHFLKTSPLNPCKTLCSTHLKSMSLIVLLPIM